MTGAPLFGKNGSLRIAVIGGGVIGLACALELRRRGARVVVYERGLELGAGTTARAAGMLGLASEADDGEASPLFHLARRSASLWPAFARDVERWGGVPVGYAGDGTIMAARTPSEVGWLEALSATCRARAIEARWLDSGELRAREPAATGPARAALFLPSDGQVDAALLLRGVGAAAAKAGVDVRLGRPVERIGAAAGFTLPDGERFDRVLLATGAAERAVTFEGRSGADVEPRVGPIVPVKGQMLALAAVAGAPRHVIRMRDVYVAPKARWILVGATEERGKNDTGVETSVIEKLRADASGLIGGLADAPRIAAWAGVRPGTPDDAPMIGETAVPGAFAAMGHYRNGVLLAPATAEIVADQMLDGKVSPLAAGFSPLRFDKAVAAPHSP